ncbi:MAG: siderophore-interacting protein [Actinomycetales bacterium]|nr:siderophore-interacting protein [Actinomycetales bacterium]
MSADRPYVLARASVTAVERPSPTFARITLRGPELDEVGTPGHTFDQRIKLILPGASGRLPDLDGDEDDWYAAWLAVPEDERGAMRTYSLRHVRRDATGTELTLDIVIHLDDASGPGTRWAASTRPGDGVLVVGPRHGQDAGGREFAPGEARWVMLAGDETAAPAMARILEDAPREMRGVALIEVPHADDVLPIEAPSGVEVRWLSRGESEPGAVLVPAVLAVVGVSDAGAADPGEPVADVAEPLAGELLWETPTYSGLGELLPSADAVSGHYYWIAGESRVVTTLRRHLVIDAGIDRGQVAFMGYWRRGTAMRG